MTEALKVQSKGVFGRHTRRTLECGLTGEEGKKKQASAIAGRYLMGTRVISWSWQAHVSRHIDSLPTHLRPLQDTPSCLSRVSLTPSEIDRMYFH